MDKLKLHTPDFVEANAAKLAELFPNCVTESRAEDGSIKRAIDFDLLRQELSEDLVEGPQERYRLDWPGKRESLALANAPIMKTLRPCREESVDFETTRNLFIEGDNLDALKLLQETYLNQVKMIYIDPPYNTGNDFIYDDNYSMSREEYEDEAGERDEEGNAMFDEEKWQQNSSSTGRFHSEWVSMMYPRLKLARNLLKDDGVIFISIDDGELANLRRLCDEVFGAGNFVASVIWHKVFASKASAQYFSESHDYILVYAKSHGRWERNLIPRTEEQKSDFKNPDNDPRGPWRSVSLSARNPYSDGLWKTTSPSGRVIDGPPKGRYWSISEAKFESLKSDNRIWWGADGNGMPRRKLFLSEAKDGIVPTTIWHHKEVGSTQDSKKELLKRVAFSRPQDVFDTPKPTKLLKHILRIATDPEEEAIVLDFFAGSGTTGEAVMALNSEDGGNRRFILVQLPEPLDSPDFSTVGQITKCRLNATHAALSSKDEGELPAQGQDTGFRVLKIDSSNMADVYYQPDQLSQDALDLQVDNVKKGREPEDLLFQVLLDWGVDLGLPITAEEIEGKRVFFVADNALAACFDTGLTEDFCKALAKREPLRAVFRDAGYASDSTKINIEQIFKALSPHTELKTL